MSEPTPQHPSLANFLHRQPGQAAAPPPVVDPRPDPAAATAGPMDAEQASPPPATPSFLRHSAAGGRPPSRVPRWQWVALAALALLLALQIVLADRERLAADARWRPLLGSVCGVLRCSLPAWHQPDAFSMLQRDIRPLQGRHGVLQVQASFRNDARWEQAWPALHLSLADADGRVIGRSTLQPGDYLGKAFDPRQRLQPGQSAQVQFLLREPSAATVAYTFEFR